MYNLKLLINIYYYLLLLYIYINACVAQLAKVSYTQAVGRGFKPRPGH